MPAAIFEYFESFTVDEAQSTEKQRVITVTLSDGKILPPVLFRVPVTVTSAEVDAFIETLCHGDGPNPISCGINLVNEMVGLVEPMLSNVQSVATSFLTFEASQGFLAGMRHLQAGIRAIDKDKLDDIAVLEGAIKSRKDSVSDAAAEVTAAAKKMIEVLVYLRHAGEISDEQFDSDVHVVSLNAFKLRVLKHAFKSEWFI